MPSIRTYHPRAYNRRPGDIPVSPTTPRYRRVRRTPSQLEFESSPNAWPFPPIRDVPSDSEDDEIIPTSDPDEVEMVSCPQCIQVIYSF